MEMKRLSGGSEIGFIVEGEKVLRATMIVSPECKHCGRKMDKWAVPTASTWVSEFNYVCFNDECPYFVKGWDWMWEKYNARASYRYCIEPASGHARPLPVWSNDALRSDIISDEDDGQSEGADLGTA